MKRIYFMRHGQTDVNVSQSVHSSPTNELSEKGHQQAKFIAERCTHLPLEVLVTSTYTRAKQTAQYISQQINIIPEESDLFIECKFIKKYWDQPRTEESENAIKLIVEKWGVPGFRVEDEENFEDIVARADKALAFLLQKPEAHIGVVTHGLFLRNLIGRALFADLFTPSLSNVVSRSLKTENTGLTILDYDTEDIKTPWKIWVWNDHAHLAD